MVTHCSFVLLLIAGLLAFTACSEKTPEAGPPQVPEQPEVVKKTSGIVKFEGVPDNGITGREIIFVSELPAEALARFERQRELLEIHITGVDPESLYPAAGPKDVSLEDSAKFVTKLQSLNSEYPAPISIDVKIKDVKVDDDRLRRFNSSAQMHKDYARLFKAIDWTNIKKGIDFINEKLTTDGRSLEPIVLGADPFASHQADVDLMWIREVVKHLESYLNLANERIEAKNDYLSQLEGPKDWLGYSAQYTHTMIADVSKNSLGSAMINEDGSFVIEAQGGSQLVRIEYGLISAYYFLGEEEKRVTVSSLREFEE
ncbi:MAG: hypothetical protein AAF065_08835 [Verrucomicrobiota bacterium]